MVTNIKSDTPLNERDSWRTPPEVFHWASDMVGGFQYDTACTVRNALAMPLWKGRRDHDALACRWRGRLWCNPPYSDIGPWIDKALDCVGIVALLIPSPNGESYYARLIPAAYEIYISGRLAFLDSDGEPRKGNTRGSSLFLLGGRWRPGVRIMVERDYILGK